MTDRCSLASRAAGLPLAGTAPPTGAWLVVEQRIPWAARALESERLDPNLHALLSGAPASVLLARRTHAQGPERYWYADRSSSTVTTGPLRDAIAALTEQRALGELVSSYDTSPALFVCTNGKRDVCCAIESRILLDALGDRDDVWQCTHLGGHRFAPTALLLPTGMMYGRLTPAAATEALDRAASADVAIGNARGNSFLDEVEQVADIHVRQRYDIATVDALTFATPTSDAAAPIVIARHRDGREWQVALQRRRSIPVPISCERELLPEIYYTVESIAVIR